MQKVKALSIMNSEYNKHGFYFLLASIFFSLIWVFYMMFFQSRPKLAEISPEEAGLSSEANSAETKQPWISTQALIATGKKVYKVQCALCHGAEGLGDGSPGLNPPPRNLVEGNWKQGGSQKSLFITLQKGVPGTSMLAFKHIPKVDRWALVHYIQSITKNKVNDDPKKLEEFARQAL